MAKPSRRQRDTCRTVEVDGIQVRVRGSKLPNAKEREAIAEVVRAVRERYSAEHPDEPESVR